MDARAAAFFDFCKEAELDPGFYMIPDHLETRTAGRQAGLVIGALPPSERPEVLICHNDVLACGIYHGLKRSGLRIPEDIAITGFDGTEEGQCLDRPLTTVLTPADELCQNACEILLKRMGGDRSDHPLKVKVTPRMLVGETT